MDDKEIARRVLAAANKKLGVVLLHDLEYSEIEYALQKKCIKLTSVATYEITDLGRSAATSD